MAEYKKPRRWRRSAFVYTPIAALLIIVLVIFGISVFFRVSEIEVNGAKKYTAERIAEESGIKLGDNLVFVDAKKSAEKIKTTLPYLDEVQIDKLIPNRVEIRVTESQPMAVASFNGAWWLIDQKAKVLEKTNADTAAMKIQIKGISPTAATVGRLLAFSSSDQTKLLYLANVLTAISGAGISGDIKTLDMSNAGSISFTYMGRFTVILGNGENTEYKLILLRDMIIQLKPDDKGRIDLSRDNQFHFIPT